MSGVSLSSYDVVIAGGGLAGLTLARQLRLRCPQFSVAVVDRLERPLPEAGFKVGESTVEIGAHYLAGLLQLENYLEKKHFFKFGLRYFFGSAKHEFAARPEWGTDTSMPVPSFQLDRGVLENDLRTMVVEDGAALYEGYQLKDVAFGEGEEDHRVTIRRKGISKEKGLRCRWFIDAMGRRRFLQTRFNLKKASPHKASSAWFRMDGRIDVETLVDRRDEAWHGRVPAGHRYFSTNHLMGTGYWVWLIPLGSGHTSIGIVTDEHIHPYRSYNSFAKAMTWLAEFEPSLHAYLKGREPLDFKGIKNFSHLSKQVFSDHRWACTGEAGVFLDPFYSPGTDTIAINNLIVQELIEADAADNLTTAKVTAYNRFFLGFIKTFLQTYTGRYPVFGNGKVCAEKILWDTCLYWVWAGQLFFRGFLGKPHLFPKLLEIGIRFSLLHRTMQDFFQEWAELAPDEGQVPFLSPLRIPIFEDLHLDLVQEKDEQKALEDMWRNLERFEEWAQYIFFQALQDTGSAIDGQPWIDAWSITLDREKWEACGLFRPTSKNRGLDRIAGALKYPAPLEPVSVPLH